MCMVLFLFSTVLYCVAKLYAHLTARSRVKAVFHQQYAKTFCLTDCWPPLSLTEGLMKPYFGGVGNWSGGHITRGFERERVFAEGGENLLGQKNSYLGKQWNVDNRKLVHQTVLCNVYYYSSLAPVWMSSNCFFFHPPFFVAKKIKQEKFCSTQLRWTSKPHFIAFTNTKRIAIDWRLVYLGRTNGISRTHRKKTIHVVLNWICVT